MNEKPERVQIVKTWIPQTRNSGEWQYFLEVERITSSGTVCLDTDRVFTRYEQAYHYGRKLAQQHGVPFIAGDQ